MKSLECRCTSRELLRLLAPTLLVLAGLVTSLQVAHRSGWLPQPPVASDPDLTVLTHQALASHEAPAADLVLAGDSTCLADVDAAALARQLPGQHRVLSLALFIWLDLSVYGRAVSDFATAHPGKVRTVVLLVSPAKLANHIIDSTQAALYEQVQPASRARASLSGSGPDWLGIQSLRRDLLDYCLATPLQGSGAEFFGFSSEIDRYMTKHAGSLVMPGSSKIPLGAARPRWKLSPDLKAESCEFRAKLPPHTRLLLGLTPGPEGTAAAGNWRRALLEQWNAWMKADGLLTNLPPTLPDIFFAAGGHLNAKGQKQFTAALARALARQLPPAK